MTEFMVGDLVLANPKDPLAPAFSRKNPALVTKVYVNSIGQDMIALNNLAGGWFPWRFKLYKRSYPTDDGALEYEDVVAAQKIYDGLEGG